MHREVVDDCHKDIWINDVRIDRPDRKVLQQLKFLLPRLCYSSAADEGVRFFMHLNEGVWQWSSLM